LQAWEAVREQWAILPAEGDDDLGLDEVMDALFGPSIEDDDVGPWDDEDERSFRGVVQG
jgi:hypothetical protein